MAGIPPEEVNRLLVEERINVGALDCPVRYEVWREYATRGPQARLRLLVERTQVDTAPAADLIAIEIERRLAALRDRPQPRQPFPPSLRISGVRRLDDASTVADRGTAEVSAFGEWTQADVDLLEMVLAVVPLTSWAGILGVLVTAGTADLEALLAPPAARYATMVEPRASWLARVLARLLGFDPDLDAERRGAADEIQSRVGTSLGDGPPIGDAIRWSDSVLSVSLDRHVRAAVSRSVPTVKGDAARQLFTISCSSLTWAVLDDGIDACHLAFRASEQPFATRVTKTLDFTQVTTRQYREAKTSREFLKTTDLLTTITPPTSASDTVDYRQPEGRISTGYRPPLGSHGTHVAGILAGGSAGTPESDSVMGMCPDLNLWDMRILSNDESDRESRLLMALQYIREVNSRSGDELTVVGVNLSVWIPYDPESFSCGWTPVCEEVRRLVRSGVVVVTVAGNSGFDPALKGMKVAGRGFTTVGITDPGNTEEAITVGATHRISPHRHGVSHFSSKGPTADGRSKPDLLAPGERIWSAQRGGNTYTLSGTSQAAPHVSGAAALLMARHPELIGQPERVKAILCKTATDLGRDAAFQGAGILDVLRALQAV